MPLWLFLSVTFYMILVLNLVIMCLRMHIEFYEEKIQ